MNQLPLFRMQNQESEHQRGPQTDFKIRSTDIHRLTSSTNCSTNTMHQRPAQMSEYEGDNMTSLHAKLHQEADKIRKWKVQTELEIKVKDKKLTSAYTQIETMKKSLLELQLDNERLSSRIEEEIDDHREIIQKVLSTRELCNVLKSTATSLEDKMLRCETEKTELKYAGRETSQFLGDLNGKFENLRLSAENNQHKLLLKYEAKRNESEEEKKLLTAKCKENTVTINELEVGLQGKNGIVTELQAALLEKSSIVEKLTESFGQIKERNKILEKDLKNKEEVSKESAILVVTIQDKNHDLTFELQTTKAELLSLQDAKDKMHQEMTDLCAKYEEELLCLKENEARLGKQLQEELSKMNICQTELQETKFNIEKMKSSKDFILLEKIELEMQIDLQNFELSNLRTDLDERKEEMHRVAGEMDILMTKLDDEHLFKSQLQDAEEDLEAKICALKLENDEQSQAILRLEEVIESKENEAKCIISKETEQNQSLQAEIELKKKELEDERMIIANLQKKLDQREELSMKKDLQLRGKSEEIQKLQGEIQEQKSLTEQYERKVEQCKASLEKFKKTYEDERKMTDELSIQLKDVNEENKEHAKSLTSQQKKLVALTKQNKEAEKEIQSLTSRLNSEREKNTVKESSFESLKEEIKELKQVNDDMTKTETAYIKELQALKDASQKDKKASQVAMQKAQELQEIAKKETENAKALTESQLAEMMGTLDSYKQSSEKILADKDAEIRILKNKLDALNVEYVSEKNVLKNENKKISSIINVLNKEKEMRMAEKSQANRSTSFTSKPQKPQLTQQTPHVAPMTPQEQVTSWTPKPLKTSVNAGAKIPQRNNLHASSSVSKKRKVAFLPDEDDDEDNDDDEDPPSSSDDLMEIEVETKEPTRAEKYPHTPNSASLNSNMAAMVELGRRMTPKRVSTLLNKLVLTPTPKKKTPETPNTGMVTSVSEQLRSIESTLQKQQSAPKTPNVRNVSSKKATSRFFTSLPKNQAMGRTSIKDKSKKDNDGQFSWFDLDSVYGFDPED